MSHLRPTQRVAAGLHAPPDDVSGPFAATQAAWRFYANPRLTLPQVAAPLADCARAGVAAACDGHALVVLDWCPLHYGGHAAKADRVALSNRGDLGYELLTALAVADRDGSPIAPLCMELRAADPEGGPRSVLHTTRSERPPPAPSPLDGVAPVMGHAAALLAGSGKAPVYLIDRGADSVGHFRDWQAAGRQFLVRADDDRLVLYAGKCKGKCKCKGKGKGKGKSKERQLAAVVKSLRRLGRFRDARAVEFKGRPARQFVAEAAVVLHRPARHQRVDKRTGKARHTQVAGEPLPLRLVVSEIRHEHTGKVLARWLLLSNLPGDVPAATVALWYYWRWRIESYHKLLKGAGQHAECWQQETAAAVARRLLVASMAAVVVWRLARDDRPQAGDFRDLLMRLSGRQAKRGKDAGGNPRRPFTEPALLDGLGVLVPMLHLLETHSPDDLRRAAEDVLPGLLPPNITALRREGG